MSRAQELAVNLAMNGISPAEIAHRIGMPISSVYTHISRARKSGAKIPHFSKSGSGRVGGNGKRSIHISGERKQHLAAYAAPRGIDVFELTERLLMIVLEDDMIDAILDDGVITDA